MSEFAANSFRSKDTPGAESAIESVVTGKVNTRSKTLGERFVSVFAEDAKEVAAYVLHDVLVPAIKEAVTDSIQQGIERLVYGQSSPRTHRYGGRGYSAYRTSPTVRYTNYNAYSTEQAKSQPMSRRSATSPDILVIENRSEAATVLDRLRAMLDQYGIVSVSDYYQLVGMTPQHVDENYGWNNLDSVVVQRDRNGNGYILSLPTPSEIRN